MELDGYTFKIEGGEYSLHDLINLMSMFEAGECQNKHMLILDKSLRRDLVKIGFVKEGVVVSYKHGKDNVYICPGRNYRRFRPIVIKHWKELENEPNENSEILTG